MEEEMSNFIKVWLSILISLSYCYVIGKLVSKGIKRLVLFVPIVCLFVLVPLKLSTINLSGGTAFFISWLGSSKLLLFAFGKGPLALDPSISLGRFVLISCLPIEIQQHPKECLKRGRLNFTIKALLLAILIASLFHHKDQMHPKLFLAFSCLLIYLLLEAILATVGAVARAALGVELEPHFDEPYLATSLQDFWGHRWNLMVTRILRPTVYKPSLRLWAHVVGPKWAQMPAVVATFVVSGLVHELIFYYFGRVRPTWEVTSFFVLHGLCLTVEIALKRILSDTWRLPRVVSGPLTVGFVMLTSFWLFFPQFLRCEADVRLIREYVALLDIVRQGLSFLF